MLTMTQFDYFVNTLIVIFAMRMIFDMILGFIKSEGKERRDLAIYFSVALVIMVAVAGYDIATKVR